MQWNAFIRLDEDCIKSLNFSYLKKCPSSSSFFHVLLNTRLSKEMKKKRQNSYPKKSYPLPTFHARLKDNAQRLLG